MTIKWTDENMKLHGKRHKGDSYYFRWHYGKQRVVQMTCEYVDKPTEAQKNAREAFTELRREVARQLRDERLRAEWLRRFEADNEGYKMLHTYVYAKLAPQPPKGGACAQQNTTCRDAIDGVSQSTTKTIHETACMPSLPVGTLKTLHKQETHIKGVSTSWVNTETQYMASLLVYNGVILPLFLPSKVPKIALCA